MKKHKGFLLIELMISLTILSIVLCVCGHFFVYTSKTYRSASNRLHVMQTIENSIERFWLDHYESFSEAADIINLPLSHAGINVPHIGKRLVYRAFKVTHEAGASVIPGYVYET